MFFHIDSCLTSNGAQLPVLPQDCFFEQEQFRRLKSRHLFVSVAKGHLTDLAHLKIKAADWEEYSCKLE